MVALLILFLYNRDVEGHQTGMATTLGAAIEEAGQGDAVMADTGPQRGIYSASHAGE